MPSTRASSSSSAELPPGTLIAGYRLERVLGRGSRAVVYEATQLALDRRVAFKLLRDRSLAARVRRLAWPEHPSAVGLFGVGCDEEHGPWLAMQLVPGGTLATASAPVPLDGVAAALAAAHAAGVVHGDVTARNVLVAGGRAHLTDFGLGPDDATAEDDRAALARLVEEHAEAVPVSAPGDHCGSRVFRRGGIRSEPLGSAASSRAAKRSGSATGPPHRHRGVALAAAIAVAVGAAALLTRGEDPAQTGAPSPAAGTRPLGSSLGAGGDVETVDCNGEQPSGTSRSCTVSQVALGGRAVVVPRDGTITAWAVRGARGTVALQVLRERDGRLVAVDRSADETVDGDGVHVARTSMPVAAGDRIALELTPGAAVGIRRVAGAAPADSGADASPAGAGAAAGAAPAERWFGPVRELPRRPDRAAGSGFDHELLLRADVSPDVRVETVAPLRAAAADGAPAGLQQAIRAVAVGGGARRSVAVVTLGSAVAVDLFDGTRRLARTPLPGADGRGLLVALDAQPGAVRVRWRNQGGERVERTISVGAGAFGR